MSMLSLWSGSLWYRNPSQNERDWWPINHKFELKAELLWDSKSFMILVKTQISFSLGMDFAFQKLDKLSKLCFWEFKKPNRYNLHCTFTYKYLVVLYLSVPSTCKFMISAYTKMILTQLRGLLNLCFLKKKIDGLFGILSWYSMAAEQNRFSNL